MRSCTYLSCKKLQKYDRIIHFLSYKSIKDCYRNGISPALEAYLNFFKPPRRYALNTYVKHSVLRVMVGTNGKGVADTAIIMANTMFLEHPKNFLKKV